MLQNKRLLEISPSAAKKGKETLHTFKGENIQIATITADWDSRALEVFIKTSNKSITVRHDLPANIMEVNDPWVKSFMQQKAGNLAGVEQSRNEQLQKFMDDLETWLLTRPEDGAVVRMGLIEMAGMLLLGHIIEHPAQAQEAIAGTNKFFDRTMQGLDMELKQRGIGGGT